MAEAAEAGDHFGWALAGGDYDGDGHSAEPGDAFGSALSARDVDRDGLADLAIGIDGEAIGSIPDAGAVSVLRGTVSTSAGLSANADQYWHQDAAGIGENAQPGDRFGITLP